MTKIIEDHSRSVQELQLELLSINKQLYAIRKQNVLAKLAELRRTHAMTRHIEAREVCFDAAEALGRHDASVRELEELEILLDIYYND